MGTDFKCGCRVSGAWYLCKKHEAELIILISEAELNSNTISDVVQDKKGKTVGYKNERPMKEA